MEQKTSEHLSNLLKKMDAHYVEGFYDWLRLHDDELQEYTRAIDDLDKAAVANDEIWLRNQSIHMEFTFVNLVKRYKEWIDGSKTVNNYVDAVVQECKEEVKNERLLKEFGE